jgi:hypothetical protein
LWSAPAGNSLHIDTDREHALESLAAIRPGASLDARVVEDQLHRRGQAGGLLVLVTGLRSDLFSGVYGRVADEFARVIVMLESDDPGPIGRALRADGAAVVAAAAGSPWGPAWNQAMEDTWFIAPVP